MKLWRQGSTTFTIQTRVKVSVGADDRRVAFWTLPVGFQLTNITSTPGFHNHKRENDLRKLHWKMFLCCRSFACFSVRACGWHSEGESGWRREGFFSTAPNTRKGAGGGGVVSGCSTETFLKWCNSLQNNLNKFTCSFVGGWVRTFDSLFRRKKMFLNDLD